MVESSGALATWTSALHDGGGPYVLSPIALSTPPTVGGAGLEFGTTTGLVTPAVGFSTPAGPSFGVAYALDAAWLASNPVFYLATLYDALLPAGYEFGQMLHFGSAYLAPQLQARSGGVISNWVDIPGGPLYMRAAGAVAALAGTSGGVGVFCEGTDPPGPAEWVSSPPTGGPVDGPVSWVLRVGHPSLGLLGTVRAAAVWRTQAGNAQIAARAAWLESL